MARKPKRKAAQRRVGHEPKPARPKLDPRLALLLSLPDRRRRTLKMQEDARLTALSKEITAAKAALYHGTESDRKRAAERFGGLNDRLFAPMTTGLFIPSANARGNAWPSRMNEPFIAAFI